MRQFLASGPRHVLSPAKPRGLPGRSMVKMLAIRRAEKEVRRR